jgi:hypothetical protein
MILIPPITAGATYVITAALTTINPFAAAIFILIGNTLGCIVAKIAPSINPMLFYSSYNIVPLAAFKLTQLIGFPLTIVGAISVGLLQVAFIIAILSSLVLLTRFLNLVNAFLLPDLSANNTLTV